MNKITTCVFDAYGTLFDVNAACRELSEEVGDKWNELASLWRLRQVEYTWLRNSMKEYIDFWKITSDALDYAMETLNVNNIKLRNTPNMPLIIGMRRINNIIISIIHIHTCRNCCFS